MTLTDKQERFCQEYIVDLNATQAAIRAGYSEDTAGSIGCENLTKPEIEKRVQELMDDRSKRTQITADRVLIELARIGFADPRSVMTWGPAGVILKESGSLSDDEAATVAEVSQTTTKEGGSIKVKMNDKGAALERLGKHLRLFTDKVEVEGNLTVVVQRFADAPNNSA